MRDGRQAAEWGRTSTVLALLFNCHRDGKRSRAMNPEDFNPYAERKVQNRITADNIEILKHIFVDNKPE